MSKLLKIPGTTLELRKQDVFSNRAGAVSTQPAFNILSHKPGSSFLAPGDAHALSPPRPPPRSPLPQKKAPSPNLGI